ncbi:hypothetical protein [Acidisoma silvae]|nr:hypothetical protein [Acidisoma silvae]
MTSLMPGHLAASVTPQAVHDAPHAGGWLAFSAMIIPALPSIADG